MEIRPSASNIAFEHGISDFSFSLYSAVNKSGDEFISPFSVSAALLLLMLGTDGTTKRQMTSTIFRGQTPTDVNLGYKTLADKLATKTNNGVILSLANKLFGSQIYTILDTYKDDSLKFYGSGIDLLDFARKPEQSRSIINSWVAIHTRNKIRDMMPPGIINEKTLLVIANAIYFKGTWHTRFDPKDTERGNFYVGSTQKQVDMMHATYNANSGEHMGLNCKVLRLPYTGKQLSMIFVLPNERNGISKLEKQLTLSNFQNLLSGLRKRDTHIEIPKFVIEAEYDLEPILTDLGITEIFDWRVSNFTKMVPRQVHNMGVYVNDARHKTFVEVNENGSEAAGATTIETKVKSRRIPFEFIADHPFVFVIRDDESGIPLFIGRYCASIK